ncbi:MAG: hypothetical protein AB1416_01570 [Actinomycetota bacterium]
MGDLGARLAAGGTELVAEEGLRGYVVSRRWFGGRARDPLQAHVVDCVPMPPGPRPLAIALVEVRYPSGTHDVYQTVLGVRGEAGKVPIGGAGGEELYDALEDGTCAPALLDALHREAVLTSPGGSTVRFTRVDGHDVDPDAPARPLGADQSNSAIVAGEGVLLKAYRRLHAGMNPELEVLRFLEEHGFRHAPSLIGWWEHANGPLEATLGVAVRFLRGAADGFTMALDALGTDPSAAVPRLRRLGEVTGRLHATLASDAQDPRFAPEEPSAEMIVLAQASLDDEIVDLFSTLVEHEHLSDLAARVEEVRSRVRLVEPAGDLGLRIRQHGDYHLGQALWHEGDWVLIDFEGEPARDIGERRRKRLPLRDVAGMLRSISYAAWVARLERGTVVSDAWEEEARAAFLDGYLRVVEPLRILPALRESTRRLLDLFELEKAVYELRYELGHRPEWAAIPAAGIAALLGREGP